MFYLKNEAGSGNLTQIKYFFWANHSRNTHTLDSKINNLCLNTGSCVTLFLWTVQQRNVVGIS